MTEIKNNKMTVALLRSFIADLKNVVKLPENLVKTCVHGRLIERADKGEEKHLVDNKRLNRPTGHGYGDNAGEYRGRGGGGRGRGRGDYNGNRDDRHGHGRGRGGGQGQGDRQGFNTRAPVADVVHDDNWRKEQDDLQAKMNRLATANIQEARSSKNDNQKVRLKLNQITPDNLDRKISELREMLIGDRKLLTEEGFTQEEADGFQINDEILSIVVQTIFRKAQVEHTYSKFYSKLCSTIVKIDLESQGKKAVPGNLKHCLFRKKLLDYCRSVYEEIFQQDDFESL